MGSAYDSFLRPLPFDITQVELFHMRLDRGLGRLTPDTLEALATCATQIGMEEEDAEEWMVEMDPNGTQEGADGASLRPSSQSSHLPHLSNASIRRIWNEIEVAKENLSAIQKERNGRLPYHQIFADSHLSNFPFHVDVNQISFGSDGNGSQAVHPVSVFNYTSAMAMASWCVPSGSVYSVSPMQQDVPPFGRVEFYVRFHSPTRKGIGVNPTASTSLAVSSGYVMGQYLECYINFKQMRSFRLCCERSFTPPHCFTVQVNQDCRAQSLDPLSKENRNATGSAGSLLRTEESVFFSPVRIGETAYQVVEIENLGDVVMTYESAQAVLMEVSDKVTWIVWAPPTTASFDLFLSTLRKWNCFICD